jgi:hypothetical protein
MLLRYLELHPEAADTLTCRWGLAFSTNRRLGGIGRARWISLQVEGRPLMAHTPNGLARCWRCCLTSQKKTRVLAANRRAVSLLRYSYAASF